MPRRSRLSNFSSPMTSWCITDTRRTAGLIFFYDCLESKKRERKSPIAPSALSPPACHSIHAACFSLHKNLPLKCRVLFRGHVVVLPRWQIAVQLAGCKSRFFRVDGMLRYPSTKACKSFPSASTHLHTDTPIFTFIHPVPQLSLLIRVGGFFLSPSFLTKQSFLY